MMRLFILTPALTYSEVGDWLERKRGGIWASDEQVSSAKLNSWHPGRLIPFARRQASSQRGALEVETVEPLFIFNDEKKIESVEARQRNDAHKIIEECMIAANVAAAETLSRK